MSGALPQGLVIGFAGANSINRSGIRETTRFYCGSDPATKNPALPPNHPPLGDTGEERPKGGSPGPEVMAAIEKAKAQPQNYEAQMTVADLYYQDRSSLMMRPSSTKRPRKSNLLRQNLRSKPAMPIMTARNTKRQQNGI